MLESECTAYLTLDHLQKISSIDKKLSKILFEILTKENVDESDFSESE